MKPQLNIAVLQQNIQWGDSEYNRRHVEEMFRDGLATASHPDILVVPETFTTGFGGDMASVAENSDGPTLDLARRIAHQHDALFVGTWVVEDAGKVYNRLHLVRPDGDYHCYDKAHTFRVSSEHDQITAGRRQLVVEWRGWLLRPAVCYDLRFPVWLRRTEAMPYDVLLLCANWPSSRREAWTTLIKARAIENQCYAVGCNCMGVDNDGGTYSGDCAVIDFKGFDIAKSAPIAATDAAPALGETCAPVRDDSSHPDLAAAERLLTATLDAEKLTRFRSRWPFALDADAFSLV